MNNWTVGSLLRHMRSTLTNAGLEDADLDARFLLQFALKMTHAELLRRSTDSVDHRTLELVLALLTRREWREPLAHILGTAEFFGREFISTREALVPRKETELLVEEALARLPDSGVVLDLACGSGCIGLTIALERPALMVFLSDVSTAALDLARRNADKLGARVRFFQSDWFNDIPKERYAAILTNPPYIFPDEAAGLAPEVLADPRNALFHENPVELYEFIFARGSSLLAPGGFILAETSPRIAAHFGGQCRVLQDYAGLDRMLLLTPGERLEPGSQDSG
jgi:release factor glutamine methyltransferase